MSLTATPSSRKSLSSQIDRLDAVLDGLADAIPAAVADAVRSAVADALREAVKHAVVEALSDPELLARLRPVTAPTPAPVAPIVTPPGRTNRAAAKMRSAFDAVRRHVGEVRETIRPSVGRVRVWADRQADRVRRWRKPATAAFGVASLVSVACYFAGPVAASLLCGAATLGLALSAAALVAGPAGLQTREID